MKTRYLILLSLSLLGFTACETTEKIEDFPLRPSQLVVNCLFSEGNSWEFQVSKSLSVLDNADLKLVDSAEVKLFRGGELLETLTKHDFDGWYRTDNNLPETGQEYSIEVSAKGFDKVLYARETLQEKVQISEVELFIKDSSFYHWSDMDGRKHYGGELSGSFDILFSDPAGVDNYYSLSVFYLDTVYESEDPDLFSLEQRRIAISSDDSSVENGSDYTIRLFMRDQLFDGQAYKVKLSFDDWLAWGGKVYYVELTSLQRAGYFYRKSIEDYNKATDDPFAEPVKIFCNIENGYGIFMAFSTDIASVSF
ncbi:MAG: DUF4249 domain-containing protein [Bacteroidales bacterium]|nr:DUF4249 domain-containing protein [Bacteroidales bacterium]